MSSFNLDFADFGAVNFDKQEVRIFKISDVTIWTKYYNPKYYIGRDFGPKEGVLYPRNTVIPDRLKYIYDAEGTRHIVPVHHGEVFYLKQVISIDGFDKTIESIDGSILCFNIEKTDCLDLNDENKTISFPYRNFYSFYFNILYDIKEGDVFINGVLRDLYNFYPDNVVTARAQGIEGFEFDSWELVQGPDIEPELLTQNPISFLGPASDIQLRANFRPDRSQRPIRRVSIINNTSEYGTVEDQYGGVYKQYDTVNLKAIPKHGYFLKAWYSTDIQIEDTVAEEISFEMPDKNVVIYITFEPYSFDVTIEDNPEGILTGAGTYKYKEQVQLTAEPINDDYVFDYWNISSLGETIKSLESNPVFSMPSNHVTAESFFRNNIFNLKITNFSEITPVVTESQQNGGREVQLSSEPPGIGYAFAGWNSKDVDIENEMSQSTKFIMPAKNVEINYSYERRFPNLIIQDAAYGGHATGGGQKVSGNTVAITATHEDGFEFIRWEIVNNAKIENFIATDSVTAFVMPISDVILRPVFDYVKYNVNCSIVRVDLSRELLASLGAPNLPYSTLDGGRIAFIEGDEDPIYATNETKRFQARQNIIVKPQADEGFIFDSYYVEYDGDGYYAYDDDLVFAMPTYDVNITATFKEFIATMSWDQNFSTAQIGSTFKLKAETWSGQTIKYKVIRGEEALIGGENGDEVFLGSGEEVEIEAYIEAGEVFPKESLRRVFTPELTARTTISIKGPSSGMQIDANRSIKGISNGLVNTPANGYNVAGVPVTIDIYDDPDLVEYLGLVATSSPTLEDWYKKPLPDNFLKYELVPEYLGDEDSGHAVVENGPEAKRLIFRTPVFPAQIEILAKTQLEILWLADYTIYNIGDTTIAQASHNGADEPGNIIEFTFSIADETIASLDGSTITFLAQGATTITLDFAGNDNYSPQSITKDLIVKKDQVITWDQDLSQVIFGDSPLTLEAQTDGPNPVEYSIYLTALGEINGENLTLNNIEGNTVITAFAPGNDFYKDAEEVTKEINIYDENKDTDGDGIPDYLDEFPEQTSDSITWTQDLSLNAADSLELTAVSDSGSLVYYQFEDPVDSTIAELNGSTLSTTLDAAGETLKIKAYTVETREYFSAENIRIMIVAVPRDTDGDGIPDVNDPWAFQQDDSITWDQDLSSINAGSDATFTASSDSGETVLYRFSWNPQTPEPSSTYGSLSNGVFSSDDGAEGLEIRIEAYTEASEDYFSASSIRTFTIIEPLNFKVVISEPQISWAMGANSELFLKNDGTVRGYGDNSQGEHGVGNTQYFNGSTPSISNVKKVVMGTNHSLFLQHDGTVWSAGDNGKGQLGDGTNVDKYSLTRVLNISGIIDVAAGNETSYFITSEGHVYSCGENGSGQLGIGTWGYDADANTPTLISGFNNVSSIAGAWTHTLFLKNDGTVWGCGNREEYKLGQNKQLGNALVPEQISTDVNGDSFDNIIQIAAEAEYSLFLKGDGTVWGCGYSRYGELGTGQTYDRLRWPEKLPINNAHGLPVEVRQIAAANNMSIVLDKDWVPWSAGYNATTYSLGINSYGTYSTTFTQMRTGPRYSSYILGNIRKIVSSHQRAFGLLDWDGYLWWTGSRDPESGGITTAGTQKWLNSIDLDLIPEVNGTISADVTTAKAAETVTITAVPNSGYLTSNITVNSSGGAEVPVTLSGNTATFSMPSSFVTVSATFSPVPAITWDQDFSGVLAGQNIELTATTNTGSEVSYRMASSAEYPALAGHARIVNDGEDDYGNNLSGWWLSTHHEYPNVDYLIEAYTGAPENLSIIKVVNQGGVLDTDGDGIADVIDTHPNQYLTPEIIWDQDLSNILPGDSLVLTATETAGYPIYFEIFSSSTTATISQSGPWYDLTFTLTVPSTETVGNTINIRVYVPETSNRFYAKLERSFIVQAPPEWDITVDSTAQNGSIQVTKSATEIWGAYQDFPNENWSSSVTVLAEDSLFIKTTPSTGYGVTDQTRLIKDACVIELNSFSFIRDSDGAVYSYGPGRGGIFGVFSYDPGEYVTPFNIPYSSTSWFFGDFMTHSDGSLATGFNRIFDNSRTYQPSIVLLHSDGTVWATGKNRDWVGSCDLALDHEAPNELYFFHPRKLKKADGSYLTNVTEVFCAHSTIFALDSSGKLWSRGYNYNGQAAHDPANNPYIETDCNSPSDYIPWFQEVSLPAGLTVKQVSIGNEHSIILFTNGDVYSCGAHEVLGYNNNGSDNGNLTKILSNVSSVSAGSRHSLFLMNNGTVKATGYNPNKQLGRPLSTHTWQYDGSLAYTTDILDVYSSANTPITGVDEISCLNNVSLFVKGSELHACGSAFDLPMYYYELPDGVRDGGSNVQYATKMSISGNGSTPAGILYPDIDASQIKLAYGRNGLYLSKDKKKVYYWNYSEQGSTTLSRGAILFGFSGNEKYLMDLWFDAPVMESTTEVDVNGNPFRVAAQAMKETYDSNDIPISEATTADASFYFGEIVPYGNGAKFIYGTNKSQKDYKVTKKFFPA